MKKKNHFRFNSKKAKTNFFNKKVNDLTVSETIAYGAACSVVALAISLVPLAVIGIKEKMEENRKPMYDSETGFKINYSDEDETTEEF